MCHYKILIFIALLTIQVVLSDDTNDYCDKDIQDCNTPTPNIRYMFYDVNPPEGFNLRRDVYMRFAIFARALSQSANPKLNSIKLVLPPWSNLYHWQTRAPEPQHLPWSLFFDIESLRKFAPVIEMHEFFTQRKNIYGYVKLDQVYILQHFEDMFTSGKFEEKMALAPCVKAPSTNFFYFTNITSKDTKCLSFHGHTSSLANILRENSAANTIYFDHGEVALHDRFGDKIYWQCRRSMRFNRDLVQIAADFRAKFLNSSDHDDGTQVPRDWRDEAPRSAPERDARALGGPYLSVHLRRRDFVYGRPKQVPSIENTAQQIREALMELALDTVFVATDAPEHEYEELKSHLLPDVTVWRFRANKEVKKQYQDGGVAIIDQVICAHARYFLGTYESTFSFRIQEEREILGFAPETTFKRLCGNEERGRGGEGCTTSKWRIVH